MKCIWLERGEVSVRELAKPEPEEGEALIRVQLAGICATDLEMVKGYMPFSGVLGHEFVGVVEAAPGAEEWVGRRVVGEINLSCGLCGACRAGRGNHCTERSVLGIVGQSGTFAQFLCLPRNNLHPVPDGVSDQAAVFCEPLAAACRILEQVSLGPDSRVLVMGAGRLGQLIAQVLATVGCDLRVVARHSRQQDLLATYGIRVLPEGGVPSAWADLAVEVSGSADGFEVARKAVRPQGTIVLKSTYLGKVETDLSRLVVDEISLVGSRCGPFPAALEMLDRGQVDPIALIEATYPLEEGPAALEHAAKTGVLKVLLDPAG